MPILAKNDAYLACLMLHIAYFQPFHLQTSFPDWETPDRYPFADVVVFIKKFFWFIA